MGNPTVIPWGIKNGSSPHGDELSVVPVGVNGLMMKDPKHEYMKLYKTYTN